MEDKHLADAGTDSEFIVDSILCHFSTEELRDLGLYEDRHDDEVLYWVRWEGYGPEHDTLEPEEQLEGLEKLEEYKRRYGVVTERTPLKRNNRDHAFFLRGQNSVPVLQKKQWMARRRARPRKASAKNRSTSNSKGHRRRKRPSTPASKALVSAGFELSEDDSSPSPRKHRKRENALLKTCKDQDVTSRGGWSAVSARGTVTLESVSSVPEDSNDSRRQQIHVDEPDVPSAETASGTSALDASSALDGTTESNLTTEVTSKGGPERICEDDAPKQTTPSSATRSLLGSQRRRTPSFDCCVDVQVGLPFAPDAPPPIERVDAFQDSVTDPPDALLLCANPFANWIKNRTDVEDMSATDNPHHCPAGKDFEHATPIDGRLPTNAECMSKPLKGILKKPACQVAVACSADETPESPNSYICETESTSCLLVRQERRPRVDAPEASSEDRSHSPPSASAWSLRRQLPLGQLEERVLTFCDPRDANNYHWEVRDRRHLDWHAAMKYVRLVAESSDYFEGEDYEPVVFEVSGKNSR